MPSNRIFASPQDVETAFYEALAAGDLDAMMQVWSEDEEIVCIHPGWPRLSGYAEVRESFRRIFANDARMTLHISQQHQCVTPFAVISHVLERFGQEGEENLSAPVAATNIYTRGALGWRMVAHHASPVPPDSVDASPRMLH
jgi:ketosteroid isomerase-like protein